MKHTKLMAEVFIKSQSLPEDRDFHEGRGVIERQYFKLPHDPKSPALTCSMVNLERSMILNNVGVRWSRVIGKKAVRL
jgi:hypothetical protein